MKRFTVVVDDCGDVWIEGKFVRQLCFDSDSIGMAVSAYLDDNLDTED